MKNKINIFFLLICVSFLSSCFEDEGVYEYDTINEIEISGLEDDYLLILDEPGREKVVLSPTLGFKLSDSQSLKYTWMHDDGMNHQDTLNSESVFEFTPEKTGTYPLRLIVTDTISEVVSYKEFTVRAVNQFTEGVIILGQGADGSGQIKFISKELGILDKTAFDIFGMDLGKYPHAVNHYQYKSKLIILCKEAGKSFVFDASTMNVISHINSERVYPESDPEITSFGGSSKIESNFGFVSHNKLFSTNSFFFNNSRYHYYGQGLDNDYSIKDIIDVDYSWAPRYLVFDSNSHKYIHIANSFDFVGNDYAYAFSGIEDVSHIDKDGNELSTTTVDLEYVCSGIVVDKYVSVFKSETNYVVKTFKYDGSIMTFERDITLPFDVINDESKFAFSDKSYYMFLATDNKVSRLNINFGDELQQVDKFEESKTVTSLNYVSKRFEIFNDGAYSYIERSSLYVGVSPSSGLGSIYEYSEIGALRESWENVIEHPNCVYYKTK